jgi:formate dehydrogenase maturation protein FdhE
MPSTIKYDIFKANTAAALIRVEAIEGFARATNRIEELAANDPTFDYFLYCAETGTVVRLLHRTSPSPEVVPSHVSQKKAG